MSNYRLSFILPALTVFAVFYFSIFCFGQADENDALRFSLLSPQGTARSMGFGGALGSVGGDFSSLSVNPAGIGIYRTSEMMISPTVKINSANGTYLGNSMSDNSGNFNIGNIGAVFTNAARGRRYKNSSWKTVSFGIGVNRLADFTSNYVYGGTNSGASSSSGSELFSIDANNGGNINSTSDLAYLGYQTGLIDYDSASGIYRTNVPYEDGVAQKRLVRERGGISEIAFSLGGNYMEKVLLGITIGVQSLRYERDVTYSEDNINDAPTALFHYSDVTERYRISGIGINAKIGAIYKFSDQFRIGAALHTPTAYAMTDEYRQDVTASTYVSDLDGVGSYNVTGDNFNYNYSMTTPWRAIASATAIVGKLGFITADYEVTDYASTRMHFDYQTLEAGINQAIRDKYRSAQNVRVGMELKLSPVSLRGGFGYYSDPYSEAYKGTLTTAQQNTSYSRYSISGGLGFRFERMFLDFSFMHMMYKTPEQPYSLYYPDLANPPVVPTAIIKNSVNNVAMTLGFKF